VRAKWRCLCSAPGRNWNNYWRKKVLIY